MFPQIKKKKKDAPRLIPGILSVLVGSSIREVHTSILSFIWVVQERRAGGREWNFLLLTTLCAQYSFINAI